MTGRDLIIHILENHLEDEDIFKDGMIPGFITVFEAAKKFDVGIETVQTWVLRGHLDSVRIREGIRIPSNAAVRIPKVKGEENA